VEIRIDGHRVRARANGSDRSATPMLLLVHGAGMDHTVWSEVAAFLERRGRPFMAVDLPRHGASGGGALRSITALADWLAELIQATGMAKPVVAGHSMGAAAVLQLAAHHPEAVGAVVLLGVAASLPVHPDLLALAESDQDKAAELIAKWGVAKTARDRAGPRVAAVVRAAPTGVLASDLGACATYEGGIEAAARIACPALFVLGAEDRMTPAAGAEALLSVIAGARRLVLPETGHMLILEAPETVAAALGSFAEEVA
jgi:pimeloyl-ACP methyl ester carboxylesterase